MHIYTTLVSFKTNLWGKMSIDNKRVRAWCFTYNNYDEEVVEFFQNICPRDASYIVFGKEEGENKTPHLQGYIEFPNARRGSAMRKLVNGKAHWEVRIGTAEEASDYCKKGNQPKEEWKLLKKKGPKYGMGAIIFEKGNISEQGKRKDLEEVADLVMEGASLKEIGSTYPVQFIKYHKGIIALKSALYEHRTTKPVVIWRYGETGLGKTRRAREAHASVYIKDGTQWWDGYEQQEAIIIDDFDGRWPIRDLLRLLDYGPYQGQYKGGYIAINSSTIYITCDRNPDNIGYSVEELKQLKRRIDKTIHLTKNEDGSVSEIELA